MPAYARQRYGPATPPAALQAWQLLAATVYNAQDGHINHATDIPQSRPGLAFPEGGLYGLRPHLWYNPAQVRTRTCHDCRFTGWHESCLLLWLASRTMVLACTCRCTFQ